MTPYLDDGDVRLFHGDALETLRALPDASVDMVATSPPFYGLRDYGVDGQIGLEASPDEWVARLVAVFREARRVLAGDGTCWIECGDGYAANRSYQVSQGYKAKDLFGAPWLLAFALRADGWWLRGAYIWAKPNAMPESVKDRCTSAHSYVFHVAKSARYWFDGEAISEPASWERWGDQTVPKYGGTDTAAGWIPPRRKESLTWDERKAAGEAVRQGTDGKRGIVRSVAERNGGNKHPRSVWTIPTQGYSGAHFATWPVALARRIILAGCPEQRCQVCGKARERITNVSYGKSPAHEDTDTNGWAGEAMPRLARHVETVGWTDCGHNAYRPGVVLDPFAGSGTTLLVARNHGRHAVGIELNDEYLGIAARRLQQLSLLTEAR